MSTKDTCPDSTAAVHTPNRQRMPDPPLLARIANSRETLQQISPTHRVQQHRMRDKDSRRLRLRRERNRRCGRTGGTGQDKLDRQRSHRSDRRTSAIPCPAGAPLPSPAGHAVHHHTVTSPNVTTKALFSPPDATHQAPALAPRADTDSHHVSQFTIASRIHQLAINA
jgi:hypothetical protein